MELRVKIEDLKKIGITLTQYLFLWGLYNNVKVKYLDIQQEAIDKLLEQSYIAKIKDKDEYLLTDKGLLVFEPENGIYEEFVKIFPTRVSNMAGETRVLSPASTDSLVGKKLKRKWYNITKNNTEFERHIIRCLQEELNLRKKEGSLYWTRNMETWLNKATWEDYQYLLEKQTSLNPGLKVGEIRL
jgi:hypothetical protein